MLMNGQVIGKLVSKDLADLAFRIEGFEKKARRRTIGDEPEKGPRFERSVLTYIDHLKHGADIFARDIKDVSSLVSSVARIHEDQNIADPYWLRLVRAIEPLSRRASKKHAAFLLDANSQLVVWDVAHLANGISEAPQLYVKRSDSHRGAWIRCAEQNCLARFLGLQAEPTDGADLAAAAHAGRDFFTRLQATAHSSSQTQEMTLVTRMPCDRCAGLYVRQAPEPAPIVRRILVLRDCARTSELTNSCRRPDEAVRKLQSIAGAVTILQPGLAPRGPQP